jgi:uncharacterized protein YoxC
MTKPERESIARKLDALTAKVGKKRDEIRLLVSDIEALLESVSDCTEAMDSTVGYLEDAKRSLDDAADRASQYA